MFSTTISKLSDMPEAAKNLLENFPDERIFAFYGKMGAGKTTFIKSICAFMGTTDPITSPTFSLVNEYNTLKGIVYHFDFYRLKDQEEAFDIGLEEYLYSRNYCFMEWPEKIDSLLPESFVSVEISELSESERIIDASIVLRTES